MKKLKLGVKGVKDILTREEMKQVHGGWGSGSDPWGSDPWGSDPWGSGSESDCPDGQVPCSCSSDSGSWSGCVSSVGECWDSC